MEQIYAWDPDVILITNFNSAVPDDIYTNKIGGYAWSSVKAVTNHHVFTMPLGSYRRYPPSADTPVTLTWIAQKVYPELFSGRNLTARVKEYYKNMYNINLTDDQISRMYNQTSAGAAGLKF